MATGMYFCLDCFHYFDYPGLDIRCPYCGSKHVEGIEG